MAKFSRYFGSLFSNAGGYAVGSATADSLRPALQEVVNRANTAHPVKPVEPEQAAIASLIGNMTLAEARTEAAKSGYGADALTTLRAVALRAPGIGELLQLWRRKAITAEKFETGLQQSFIRPEWWDAVKVLQDVPLTPEQAAAAVERGELDYDEAQAIARLSGASAATFEVLERLAGLAPSPTDLVDMKRRGIINAARLKQGLIQGNVRSEWSDALAALAEHLLSTGELANMVVQGVLEQPAATQLAALTGVTAENFGRLVQLAGSPIGGHEALDLWNRGDLHEADVDRALRQSHLKPEWVAPFKRLKRYLPSVSDLVRFAVREVYSPQIVHQYGLGDDFPEAFAEHAAQRGLERDDALAYWQAHWELPSITQGFTMLHRGVIGQAELDTLLRTKDVMPYWRDKVNAIAYLVPGRVDLRRMYQRGVITEAEVLAGYKRLGYTDDDARTLTDFAKTEGGSKARDLTLAQLTAELEGHFIDRPEYETRVAALGYSAAEVQQLADLADARRVSRARDQFIARIHSQFVGHKVDAAAARAALEQAGIVSRALELLLAEWDHERTVNVKTLTQAQIVKGYKKALLTREVALEELTDQGLAEADANLLLDEA